MSDTPIDTLIIDIEAKASDTDKAIDKFANAIGNLANSLARVDTGKLNSVGNGIKKLGDSLRTMSSIRATSVDSVVEKINKLSAIDTSQFATVSANLHQMANGIQSLGTVSENVASVGELASNISKLGNKSVQTAVTNIPQLSTALNGLMITLSEAPKVSQNVIDMTNALANLSAQGSKVGSASNSIVKGLNKASTSATRANKSFKGLAYMFGKFYANCFLLIRSIKKLWDSINGTADYLEAFNYFEVALNKVGSDWSSDYEKYGYESAEEYANSFKTRLNESLSGLSGIQISIDANGETGLLTDTGIKNLGLNIQKVTQYASQLASVTNSVGQTGEVTLATASAFTKLGADMSSLFNVDYSSVMNNLQSGLIGQSRALYKYGIDITNATLQTYAYKLGVSKAVSEMTQAEKMQLRMIAILDQSRVSWGDQANTINSLSNSIRQFKNNISEAGQILGQLFVPILSKVMPIVNGLTIAIKRLMVSIAGLFGIKLDLSEFGQGTSGLEDDIDGITDAYDDATAAAKKFSTTTLGIDELSINSPQTDTSSGTAGSVGGGLDLTDEILKATSEYEKAWQEAYDRMESKAIAFADRIEKALEPIKKIFEDISVGDWFAVGEDTSNLVSGIFDFFAKAIDDVEWEDIGNKIGDFLAGLEWLDIMSSLGNVIWEGIKGALELWFGMFEEAPFETAIITAMALWKFTDVGKKMSGLIASALETQGVSVGKLAVTVGAITLVLKGTLELGKSLAKKTIEWSNEKYGYELSTDLIDDIGWTDILFKYGPEQFMAFLDNPLITLDMWSVLLFGYGSFSELLENLFGKIELPDSIANTFEKITNVFSNLKNKIFEIWNDVSSWFSESVIEPVSDFFVGFATRVQQIFEGLWIIIQAIWIKVSSWFSENVIEPITNVFTPIIEKISGIFTKLWDKVKSIFDNLIKWIREKVTIVQDIFKNVCEKISGFFTKLWSGIKKGVGTAMNAVITGIENVINKIVDGINGLLGGFNEVVGWAADVVGTDWGGVELIQKVALGRIDVGSFEVGGFPDSYSLFMAGENGKAELLGTVGGKTAVAGGAEITGISNAVYSTSEEEIKELREMNSLLRQLLAKDTSVNIGDREIYKASVRGSKSYGRLLVT